MNDIIVKTNNLKKYYKIGDNIVKALDGVNFEVKKKEFVSIIGKSGSGKSTLLHMIGGLDIPSSGTVVVDGINLSNKEVSNCLCSSLTDQLELIHSFS